MTDGGKKKLGEEMKKVIKCPKCGAEIKVIPLGYGGVGICAKCGYLHNVGPK